MRPSKGLFWIPDALPAHVHLVTSCTFGDIEKNIAAKKYEQMVISPLESEKECKQFIDDYLKLYRKKLDRKNKKKIIKSPQAWLPVYMRTLLEEIRLHGDHKTLGRKIEAYLEAKTPVELFKYVLSRYEQDYEKENPGLVRKKIQVL
ncbi:MAG: hypothetical protein HUK40_16560 [Desulfobacter sp.]|nr:hypothetical protein [Desulfobacter sp.]